jgi:cell division transport system ATP-binding protein
METGATPPLSAAAHVPLVSLRRVSRFYRPDRPSLFDISFDVFPGEFLYVSGISGAGKSTLMRLLHCAEQPDTGSIAFLGHDVSQLKPSAISVLRRSMGVVFQDFRLIEDLSVEANVAVPLEVTGISRARIRKRVAEVLERVGLSGRSHEIAGALSGGEQQRVAIARALASEPALVLADEPTGSLDAFTADYILDLLEEATGRGAAVVLATHDRMLMAARPHRIVALESGRMVGLTGDDRTPATSGLKQVV